MAGSALTLAQPAIELQPIVSGLQLPVAATHAGDGSSRLFITLQGGHVVIYDGAQVLPLPFLAVGPLVSCCGEQGLFSVAFHPDFSNNGFFFVSYTDTAGDSVVARYTVSQTNPNVADLDSQVVILTADQPYSNHNGGQLQFGPDGYLYISIGDGGAGGDPLNFGQRLDTLLGKILRIDVDSGLPYAIPSDNPFVGVPGAREEIWAYGLRNPWRFSFDRLTGDLFIGDVGQNAWEEVDFQPAASSGGENYGWRLMEGTHCYEVGNCIQNGSLTLPILEYHHTLGCSVTGGYRYRGSAIPALQGMYVYGDYCHVRIWGALPNPVAGWDSVQLLLAPQAISSFGEDATGELYVVGHAATNGTLYRITEPTAQAGPEIAVSPGSLAFGAQLVAGGPTVPLNLSIRNVGTANLTITGVILGGSNPAPFGVIFDTGQGVLAAGQERTIALDFDPSQLGEHFAQLTILSNDPDEGATEVPLTGLGAVPPTSTVIHCLLNTSVVFAAAETLDAAVCPIVAPGDVTFLAGQRIALWEGISVGSGATFTAGIDPNLRYLTLPKAVVVEE